MSEKRNPRELIADGLVGAAIGTIIGAILGIVAVQSSLDPVSLGLKIGSFIGMSLGWIGGLFAFEVAHRWWFDFHNPKGGLAIGLIAGTGLGGILGLLLLVGEISNFFWGIGYALIDMIVAPFVLLMGAVIGAAWGLIWGTVTKYLSALLHWSQTDG